MRDAAAVPNLFIQVILWKEVGHGQSDFFGQAFAFFHHNTA